MDKNLHSYYQDKPLFLRLHIREIRPPRLGPRKTPVNPQDAISYGRKSRGKAGQGWAESVYDFRALRG